MIAQVMLKCNTYPPEVAWQPISPGAASKTLGLGLTELWMQQKDMAGKVGQSRNPKSRHSTDVANDMVAHPAPSRRPHASSRGSQAQENETRHRDCHCRVRETLQLEPDLEEHEECRRCWSATSRSVQTFQQSGIWNMQIPSFVLTQTKLDQSLPLRSHPTSELMLQDQGHPHLVPSQHPVQSTPTCTRPQVQFSLSTHSKINSKCNWCTWDPWPRLHWWTHWTSPGFRIEW